MWKADGVLNPKIDLNKTEQSWKSFATHVYIIKYMLEYMFELGKLFQILSKSDILF